VTIIVEIWAAAVAALGAAPQNSGMETMVEVREAGQSNHGGGERSSVWRE
jgi:hypothetical protein